ncbi:hypothetical protein CANCADRAFT_18181, partial [Tortispora caseinolytica NRRL Y-17796]
GKTGAKRTNRKSCEDGAVNVPEAMCSSLFQLQLSILFDSSLDYKDFVGMFHNICIAFYQDDRRCLDSQARLPIIKLLCIIMKNHNYISYSVVPLLSAVRLYENVSRYVAELVKIFAVEYESSALIDEMVKQIKDDHYSATDSKTPKNVAEFIVYLSEYVPRPFLRQFVKFTGDPDAGEQQNVLLNSENSQIRSAIITATGNLLLYVSRHREDFTTDPQPTMDSLFAVLIAHVSDMTSLCRKAALQGLQTIMAERSCFREKFLTVAMLSKQRLEDKTFLVRRKAITTLTTLLKNHPYGMIHGKTLNKNEWSTRLTNTSQAIAKLEAETSLKKIIEPVTPAPQKVGKLETLKETDESQLADILPAAQSELVSNSHVTPVKNEQPDATGSATDENELKIDDILKERILTLQKLRHMQEYYSETLDFISLMEDACSIALHLLDSKRKGEVIDAMDFFVTAETYQIQGAAAGIRQMIHLVWVKLADEESGVTTTSVQGRLLEFYTILFFTPRSSNSTQRDKDLEVARSLITLTYGSSLAELASLEKLITLAMSKSVFTYGVITSLWDIYSLQGRMSHSQRRGAIIILGMMAASDNKIVTDRLAQLTNIGLGSYGREDPVLAKYTCIALRHMVIPSASKDTPHDLIRLPTDHDLIARIVAVLLTYSSSTDWFGACEAAVKSIYHLADHPDVICTHAIRQLALEVFSEDGSPEEDSVDKLCQLIFLVGQVAIEQIVYMEYCEKTYKRLKAQEKARSTTVSSAADDLDRAVAPIEDDISDTMNIVREKELLYGSRSLLARFAPMVSRICSRNLTYRNAKLQNVATLTMTKFMCVSGKYCEDNLPLLLTILQNSKDPIIRSNIVIGLGDLAVSFNGLIEANTSYLYSCLEDSNVMVRRTCLTTLSFLILVGQLKVKGQLGHIAKCLVNDDKSISELAATFFTEFAAKDNALYNAFVDTFSILCAEESLDFEKFKHIIQFLVKSMSLKDSQVKQLVERLLSRLAECRKHEWERVIFTAECIAPESEDV